MISVLWYSAALWVSWLFLNGLITGEVWVKGGAKDRFSRSLDMESFAHKVSKQNSSFTYWFNMAFYFAAVFILIWVGYTKV
ncbi:MAG: hypothetical protein K6L75_14150 [Cellvibrionaceae bacterium]